MWVHQIYTFQSTFEHAVELINAGAGFLIIFAIVFAVLNLSLSLLNSVAGFEMKIINPLHQTKQPETATIGHVRLILGQHTALVLGILVAAGYFPLNLIASILNSYILTRDHRCIGYSSETSAFIIAWGCYQTRVCCRVKDRPCFFSCSRNQRFGRHTYAEG